MTQQHSVTYTYVQEYPRPTPPLRRRGFRAWITRANSKAREQHDRAVREWERSGGKRNVTVHIPRAEISVSPDPKPFASALDGTKTFTVTAHAVDWDLMAQLAGDLNGPPRKAREQLAVDDE